MKFRNLMVLVIIVFGISVLAVAEEPKVEWEYIKGGQGMGIVRGASYDEVWERAQDVLLFEKFKPRGCVFKVRHETITVEKSSGLIAVKGFMGQTFRYTFKVIIQEKDDQIVVKTRCSSAWKKRVIEKFFQLLEEGL